MNLALPRTRNANRKRPAPSRTVPPAKRPKSSSTTSIAQAVSVPFSIAALLIGIALAYAIFEIHARYSFALESPIVLHFRSPLVIIHKTQLPDATNARFDQNGRPLTAYQQYTCAKFGSDCRIALAIQRAENPQGKCEIYHYNTDGTLDWGYFQINTVHLKRPGVNLRSLLDCKANIDFAYQLYREQQGFTAWSTYNSGAYRRFLRQ